MKDIRTRAENILDKIKALGREVNEDDIIDVIRATEENILMALGGGKLLEAWTVAELEGIDPYRLKWKQYGKID